MDHLGVAVPDLDGAVEVWRDVLGLELEGYETVADQGVRVAKLKAGDDIIELLEPMSADSPIAKFLGKRGAGMHHLCLEVDDLESTLARFKERGLALIDEVPRIGAGGHRIAFVHPRSTGGVLVELSELAS